MYCLDILIHKLMKAGVSGRVKGEKILLSRIERSGIWFS